MKKLHPAAQTRKREAGDRPTTAPPTTARLTLVDGPSLERRLGLDLLAVLEAEVPDVDAALVGRTITAEARRREAQEGRAWGDRPRGAA